VLVAADVAVLFVLLTAGGLLLNSLWRIVSVSPGFKTRNVLALYLWTPREMSWKSGRRASFERTLLARAANVPGIVEAATASNLPFGSGFLIGLRAAGQSVPCDAEAFAVDPSYRPLIQLPLRRGRWLAHDDKAGGHVVVVNEALARRCFPGVDPVGRQLTDGGRFYEVVGVAASHSELLTPDRRFKAGVAAPDGGPGLIRSEVPAVYLPSAQVEWDGVPSLYLLVRTDRPPELVAAGLRREIAAVGPDVTIREVATYEEYLAGASANTRFYGTALGVFAFVALALAAVGVYGVLGQLVGQRVREIGVRMALGASRARIGWLVISGAMIPVAVGLAVGLGLAWSATRLLRSFLFELSPSDPATFAASAVVLGSVAFGAAYLPMRRATRVDPATALRWE